MKGRAAAVGLLLTALLMPAVAAAAPADYDIRIHRAKEGDNLFDLAARYRVAGGWPRLQKMNNVRDVYRIPVGTALRIPVRASVPGAVAAVSAFRGEALLVRGKVETPVTLAAKVIEGDGLRTGANSFISLALADGSQVTVPSNSRLKVARLRRDPRRNIVDQQFVLDEGDFEARAAPVRARASRFQVRTPVAVAAVRGTDFRIGFDSASSGGKAEVMDGAVGVTGRAGEVRIPATFGTLASPKGVVPPIPLLPAPALSRAGDRFVTAALAGAKAWQFDVARDAAFVDRVERVEGEKPEARFAALPSGDYFVRASAIDDKGLVGLPAVVAVKLLGEDAVTAVSACPAAVSCLQFRLPVAARAGGNRLVIARDVERKDVVFDRAGLDGDALTVVGLAPGRYVWWLFPAGVDEATAHPQVFDLLGAR
ncbi:FecR domain-containing protein [Sandaracinobacteroides saxicola]|uniref:FecR domain-containing protein n=1 Tax=Sandaracinobacteroides saxicola TaxID=2759707 RepID=A0A7G5IEV5_9SPHN|nr:FecR domain-containing protein [Sandaracinobacteroides saxicola]QMW21897.1 FecR domain-containing protein [Sandaracinobacteroides saxicola]